MARTAMGSTSVKALNEKIGEVEALIAQACEAENFELAGILNPVCTHSQLLGGETDTLCINIWHLNISSGVM